MPAPDVSSLLLCYRLLHASYLHHHDDAKTAEHGEPVASTINVVLYKLVIEPRSTSELTIHSSNTLTHHLYFTTFELPLLLLINFLSDRLIFLQLLMVNELLEIAGHRPDAFPVTISALKDIFQIYYTRPLHQQQPTTKLTTI